MLALPEVLILASSKIAVQILLQAEKHASIVVQVLYMAIAVTGPPDLSPSLHLQTYSLTSGLCSQAYERGGSIWYGCALPLVPMASSASVVVKYIYALSDAGTPPLP
jgi:hypothetical protein